MFADGQISQQAMQWMPFAGASEGEAAMTTNDLLSARLDQMIDMRHPLAVLATRMPWVQTEASLAPLFVHRARPGRIVTDAVLFSTTAKLVGAGLSNAGRPRLHCDESQIERFRQVLGEASVEAAVNMGSIKCAEFERVIVDTAVQANAIAHPDDSWPLKVARAKIAQLATRSGIKLKQSYAAAGQQLRRRAGGAIPTHGSASGHGVCCAANG